MREIVSIRAGWYLKNVPEQVEGNTLHADRQALTSYLSNDAFDFALGWNTR